MHEYFPKLLHLKVKIFNFLQNFSRKNQKWNKYEILGVTPPGYKKPEKKIYWRSYLLHMPILGLEYRQVYRCNCV